MIDDDIMIDTEIAILTTKRGHGTVNTYQTLGEEGKLVYHITSLLFSGLRDFIKIVRSHV